MGKSLRFGLEDIVHRITMAAVLNGDGRDLLLRIYCAGVFHGVELSKRAVRK